MTPQMPLSIADRPQAVTGNAAPPLMPIDVLHDGLVRLRRRQQSRLWFRLIDPACPAGARRLAADTVTSPAPLDAVETSGADKLVRELVRVVRETGPLRMPAAPPDAPSGESSPRASVTVEPTAAEVTTPAPLPATGARGADPTVNGAAWRAVKASAPVFLLSAGPVLEIGRPGPILGPGMRYRLMGMTGSVVALEVMHANGDTRTGYANAVDLRCIDPTIQTGEFQSEKGFTGRLRMTRLATTTFGLFGG